MLILNGNMASNIAYIMISQSASIQLNQSIRSDKNIIQNPTQSM